MSASAYAYNCLKEECLEFPAFRAAFDQMTANLQLYRTTGVAQHLLILGESGTGKTTLSRLFAARYPRHVQPDRDIVPVLWVAVPPAATIVGTAEAILAQLGDLAPTTGTISKKTTRAVRLFQGCSVEMLLLDEAQHINDRGRARTQYFVGDWLKSFIDAVGIPVCMLGLPRSESLLQVNDQLRRRFTHRLSLAVHVEGRDSSNEQCLRLFSTLADMLQTKFRAHPYGWQELGQRLHFATDSRISYVKQLLVGAFHILSAEDLDAITVDVLERAFASSIWSAGVGALNPFNPNFVFRGLDRMGEPFERLDIGAMPAVRGKK